jgi:hypothetical protein
MKMLGDGCISSHGRFRVRGTIRGRSGIRVTVKVTGMIKTGILVMTDHRKVTGSGDDPSPPGYGCGCRDRVRDAVQGPPAAARCRAARPRGPLALTSLPACMSDLTLITATVEGRGDYGDDYCRGRDWDYCYCYCHFNCYWY